MKKVVGLILMVCLIGIAGCSVNPSKIGDEYAIEFMDKITYVQDPETGLCFAIIATRKTMDASQTGIGITEVPCACVYNKLVKPQ